MYIYEDHWISFQSFFVWALSLIVHTSNTIPLRSNLRLQCTYYTVPTTFGRPHRSPLVRACQWTSSQPLSSPQLSHNCYIVIYTFIRHHNDTIPKTDAWRITYEGRRMKKRQEDIFRKIFTSHFICKVSKGCMWEDSGETEHKLHILTPLLWPWRCVFLVFLDAQPEVLGSNPSGLFRGPPRSGVAFPTTSGLYCLEVCWQLHRGFSDVPLGRVWFSLPHLVSTVWISPGNCFGTPNSTELNNNSTPTQSPTGSLNRMFNRHQAEITVMQFTGYSLQVHDGNGRMGPSPSPIS